MAFIEGDTRVKIIDSQIKSSQWLESNIVREYYFTQLKPPKVLKKAISANRALASNLNSL